jgi:hypothetical protein
MTTTLVLDALNMAAWTRRHTTLDGLICHTDAGNQLGFNRLQRAPLRRRRGTLHRHRRGLPIYRLFQLGGTGEIPNQFARFGGMMLAFGDAFGYRCCGDRWGASASDSRWLDLGRC